MIFELVILLLFQLSLVVAFFYSLSDTDTDYLKTFRKIRELFPLDSSTLYYHRDRGYVEVTIKEFKKKHNNMPLKFFFGIRETLAEPDEFKSDMFNFFYTGDHAAKFLAGQSLNTQMFDLYKELNMTYEVKVLATTPLINDKVLL